MNIEPRQLEAGWKKRTFLNAVQLCLRSPGWWFVTYVGVPALTFYLPYPPVQAVILCLSLIFGTFRCFSCDHLSNSKNLEFMTVLKQRPQPLIHTVFITVLIALAFEDADFKMPQTPFESYFSFGSLLFFVYFAHLMGAILILMTLDIPRLLLEHWKSHRRELDFEADFQPYGILSLFTRHLCVDTNLDWASANKLSERGVEILGTGRLVLMVGMPLILVCPPLLGLFVPWTYCIYRELFWQQGITSRLKQFKDDALVTT